MKIKDLKRLLKEKSPQQIIGLYINNAIYLTDKQIDKLIEEKKKRGD